MGFHCRNDAQFAFVILMTPNGRLLALRPPRADWPNIWQVTVSRTMSVEDFVDEEDHALKAAIMAVFTRFAFRPSPDDLSKIACHYSLALKKLMHLYICKIPSGVELKCSGYTEIRIMTLERVCNELFSEPENFTIATEEAINLISGLKQKSRGAP
jgi:hypothetical protein